MSNQTKDYQNLEELEQRLMEERRLEVSKWARDEMGLTNVGEKVMELNAMLDAVRTAKKEEYTLQGIAGMVG